MRTRGAHAPVVYSPVSKGRKKGRIESIEHYDTKAISRVKSRIVDLWGTSFEIWSVLQSMGTITRVL